MKSEAQQHVIPGSGSRRARGRATSRTSRRASAARALYGLDAIPAKCSGSPKAAPPIWAPCGAGSARSTDCGLTPSPAAAEDCAAEIVPELITLDDWGFPIIRDGDVPDRLLDEARGAVRVCPKLALRLEGPH